MDQQRYNEAVIRLVAAYSKQYQRNAKNVAEKIMASLQAGHDLQIAIADALNISRFFQKNKDSLESQMIQAAAAGYGIDAATISVPQQAIITQKLNSLPWTPDNMPLSTRLHGNDHATRRLINDTISANMKSGTNWVKTARELYDGYNAGSVIPRAELPGYLKKLQRLANQTMGGAAASPRELYDYNRAIKRAQRLIDGMAADGAPNRALKAAYRNLLDKAQNYSADALSKAVHVATEERSRYFAERIARTEIARAWADGFYAKHHNDPDVVAYRWRLSSRHPKTDICDVHKNADMYGMGPGIYPKNNLPRQPAHPHCLCHWSAVYDGQIDTQPRNRVSEGGREYIDSMTPAQQESLLGKSGAESYRNGGNWQNLVNGWSGHENPVNRLQKRDFDLQLFSRHPEFNYEKAFIPDGKLEKYALDKEHPVGKHKAIVFEKVLGYTKDNYLVLKRDIQENIHRYQYIYKGDNQYGSVFEIILELTGPNGRTANVLTSWIIKYEDDFPALTTTYVAKEGKKANASRRT